jgi:hypothetical protein
MPADINWPELFDRIEREGMVPSASSEDIDRGHATFQAMYLDLGDIKNKIAAAGVAPPLVTIYADVLNIPAGLAWTLKNSVLSVMARQVQIGETAKVVIDYREAPQVASLIVFADEIDGSLAVLAVVADSTVPYTISAPTPEGGVRVFYADGTPQKAPVPRAQGIPFNLPDAFLGALTTEFLFASLLYDQEPAIALVMLRWLKEWSGESKDLLGLFLRSSSLLALLGAEVDARADGAQFVPYLTSQVYTDLATAFVAEAQQYERDYRTLEAEKVLTDDDIKLAQTLLDNQTYQSEYVEKLLAQAKSNYDNAVAAASAADSTLSAAQRKADQTWIDFEDRGIPAWRAKKIEEAIISLGSNLIVFGVGIAAMFVGDEVGGAESVDAAIKGTTAVEQAAEAGSEVADLSKQLADVMKQLKKMAELLKQLCALTLAVINAANNLEQVQKYTEQIKQLDVTGGGAVSAASEWQVYRVNADAVLKVPVEQKIEFAEELQVALDTVAIYGQQFAAAQLAVVQAGQVYSTIMLQKELAQAQQAQLAAYVQSLKAGEAPIAAMMRQFYQRYLDAKSSLFAAIQGYRASYFYWALQPSTVAPKIIDAVDQLDTGLEDLTAITMDKASALEHFSPPPQDLTDAQLVIVDAEVLDQLRQHGQAIFTVGLDVDALRGFDRVRLTRVRAWIEGATPDSSQLVTIALGTAGGYLDRFQGTSYQFTSKPLQRSFQYRVTRSETDGPPAWRFADDSCGYVVLDGSVDQEVRYAYFEPTPFAQWQISVSSCGSLAGVTRITLQLAGSVIPQSHEAAARATQTLSSRITRKA